MTASTTPRVKRGLNFAEHFKQARLRHGLSQTEAADEWKIPLRALRNWEQGLRAPNGRTLIQLVPVLFPQIADVWRNMFEREPRVNGRKSRRRKQGAQAVRRG